jgi:hypothetical protein
MYGRHWARYNVYIGDLCRFIWIKRGDLDLYINLVIVIIKAFDLIEQVFSSNWSTCSTWSILSSKQKLRSQFCSKAC